MFSLGWLQRRSMCDGNGITRKFSHNFNSDFGSCFSEIYNTYTVGCCLISSLIVLTSIQLYCFSNISSHFQSSRLFPYKVSGNGITQMVTELRLLKYTGKNTHSWYSCILKCLDKDCLCL